MNLVLATLDDSEFRLRLKWGAQFSGYLTREGFDKLARNTQVQEIYLTQTISIAPVTIINEIPTINNTSSGHTANMSETKITEETLKSHDSDVSYSKSWIMRLIDFIKSFFRGRG